MRHTNDHEEGFTLIELLIVMSIILILATLAIPAMQKSIMKANETSAIASVRDLMAQENQYNSTYPTHGFSCSLAALGGKNDGSSPTPESAQLIPEDLAAGSKSGYQFGHQGLHQDHRQQPGPDYRLHHHRGPQRRPTRPEPAASAPTATKSASTPRADPTAAIYSSKRTSLMTSHANTGWATLLALVLIGAAHAQSPAALAKTVDNHYTTWHPCRRATPSATRAWAWTAPSPARSRSRSPAACAGLMTRLRARSSS